MLYVLYTVLYNEIIYRKENVIKEHIRKINTFVVFIEKNTGISEIMQFNSMLFKGQLYMY